MKVKFEYPAALGCDSVHTGFLHYIGFLPPFGAYIIQFHCQETVSHVTWRLFRVTEPQGNLILVTHLIVPQLLKIIQT